MLLPRNPGGCLRRCPSRGPLSRAARSPRCGAAGSAPHGHPRVTAAPPGSVREPPLSGGSVWEIVSSFPTFALCVGSMSSVAGPMMLPIAEGLWSPLEATR